MQAVSAISTQRHARFIPHCSSLCFKSFRDRMPQLDSYLALQEYILVFPSFLAWPPQTFGPRLSSQRREKMMLSQ